MKRKPVTSTSINEIGYDPKTKTMEIQFNTGFVYQFLEVPKHVHTDFMMAPSIGSFFYRFIRANYRTIKVEAAPPDDKQQKLNLEGQLKDSIQATKKPRRRKLQKTA